MTANEVCGLAVGQRVCVETRPGSSMEGCVGEVRGDIVAEYRKGKVWVWVQLDLCRYGPLKVEAKCVRLNSV